MIRYSRPQTDAERDVFCDELTSSLSVNEDS